MEQAMAGVQRMVEYKDQPIEDAKQARREAVSSSWPEQGLLKLTDADMRYAEDLPLALKKINLEVKPGEKVGIVGRTGSGKSSIVLTCFRLIDCCSGKVELDQQDLAAAPLAEVRSRLGVIPQDSWLFSGTVRSNLDVWSQKSDEEIWTALRHAQLDGQIQALEGGLNHEVKEKGENLSAGTAQLLCLARVLLKEPKLLFMDEATASVDTETDKLVQETIRKDGVLPAGCSIVTVAHRLHTVIDYDRIIVLSEGSIVEEGAPDKLLEDESGYLSALVADTGKGACRELKRRSLLAADERNKVPADERNKVHVAEI
jgi:ABC-type multidrug transport system fused ATPase/permease subunit